MTHPGPVFFLSELSTPGFELQNRESLRQRGEWDRVIEPSYSSQDPPWVRDYCQRQL